MMLGCTYDRSRGVAGVDPDKLCAKVAAPPSCLPGFCMPPELMGPTPPKAQPVPLFTGIAARSVSALLQDTHMRRLHSVGGASSPYPVCRLVTYLLPLFQYVVSAGLLQSRRASLLGTGERLLADTAFVSQRSF